MTRCVAASCAGDAAPVACSIRTARAAPAAAVRCRRSRMRGSRPRAAAYFFFCGGRSVQTPFEDFRRHADRLAERRMRVDRLADVGRRRSPSRSPGRSRRSGRRHACRRCRRRSMRCVASSNSSLVKPSSRPLAMARPDAAHGNTALPTLMPFGLALRPRSCRPMPLPDRCRPPTESAARRNTPSRRAPLRPPRAPRAPPCAPASAGRRCRRSRRCAARWCASACRPSMKPRSVTATPALSAPIFLPFGLRPTATSTRS